MSKKVIILTLLLLFIVGLTCGAVSASHTVKVGKYKAKLSEKQYKYLKNCEAKNINGRGVLLKTGKYYHYKEPIYKTKKVKNKKKKVKVGTRPRKEPIYMTIAYSPGGQTVKGIIATVWSDHYFEKHEKCIVDAIIKL